jgi:hypothetical protein
MHYNYSYHKLTKLSYVFQLVEGFCVDDFHQQRMEFNGTMNWVLHNLQR